MKNINISKDPFVFARNLVAKGLGIFWLLDGLLMLQPKMFGEEFINNVLVPNLNNQPSIIHYLINFGINLYNYNIFLANVGGTIIQLLIGVLLLFPIKSTTFKIGLYISIIWSLFVWIFGEGVGNLFTGSASFYTGAPGSVLIYVLIAVLLLLLISKKIRINIFPQVAGFTFIVFSALQLQLPLWTQDGIRSMLNGSSSDSIGIISHFSTYVASVLSQSPIISNLILIFILLILGLGLILKPNPITASASIIFLFIVWWLGQDFGGLSTLVIGTSTDPNTAPVLVLLLLPAFLKFPKDVSSPTDNETKVKISPMIQPNIG